MILVAPIFAIFNILFVYILEVHKVYYVTLIEGVIIFIYVYTLLSNKIFSPIMKNINITNNELKKIKNNLIILSLTYIILSILFIVNVLPEDLEKLLLVSIPVFITALLFDRVLKIKKNLAN
ncbi:hypothetical protein NNC19_20575 [Clostridium sp. SHJSY1]|uniref:hypothetical protein n=1 Tax=Clostridium sp. SHJSY1 TaxID=2942483 RepID=UPI00287544CA|nr:hypothetical protein [Clostridium sp. SHJSY1]MDS0528094.1 hypothetical protein [Clostridium sp. SHJSY1]